MEDWEQIIEYYKHLLSAPMVKQEVPAAIHDDERLQDINEHLLELREVLGAFSQGDISVIIKQRGMMAGALKALQAHLRHITWQIEQVAQGDFSQRVEFLGDFSKAFNDMVLQLQTAQNALAEEIAQHESTILALQESEARFRFLSEHDSLTGIANRRSFFGLAESEVRIALNKKHLSALVLIDLDKFKNFNDTYGHLNGDLALKHCVNVVKRCLREYDIFGRYGGEEFIIFLAKIPDHDVAVQIAERIRKAIEKAPVVLDNENVPITASMGLSLICPKDEYSSQAYRQLLQDSIAAADEALYLAKEQGRNRICCAEE